MPETLWQDVRYGVRVLIKYPSFTLVAMLTLALGIGATTAIFSVLNGVLLRPLSYPHPDRLVQLWETNPPRGWTHTTVSPLNFADWQKQTRSFEAMAAYEYESFTLTGGDAPEWLSGARVSASFFDVMGVKPVLGRSFLPEEDHRGANRVVILSHRLWQRRFGANADILGETLTLNNESFKVIGVMPADFGFPSQGIDVWAPPAVDLQRPRSDTFLFVIGRLKPAVSLRQAQGEMNLIAQRLAEQYPDTNKFTGVILIPLHDQIVGRIRPALLILLGAVLLLLLIACVNVANLLLARATARHKEIAVRAALGASRQRLIRQLLTESVLLGLLGGCLGFLLSIWGVDLLVAASAGSIPLAKKISLDGRVFGFMLAVSLATGILFGLAPALRSSAIDLNQSLKEGMKGMAGGLRRTRMQSSLVVSEIGLAFMLLIGAGLLIKSYARLRQVDPGFRPENVLTMQLSLPQTKYPQKYQQAIFFKEVLEHLKALPGVQSAGAISDLPFSGSRTTQSFKIAGHPANPEGELPEADYRKISPEYFHTMGIRLMRGREFTEHDTQAEPQVAIINEAMAHRFFIGENPLGGRLLYGEENGREVAREIVGVVGDLKHDNLAARSAPEVYVPYLQDPPSWMFLVIRSASGSAALITAVQKAITEVDPDEPVYNVMLMEQRLEHSLMAQRFDALLLGIFAAVAMILAATGIYGVMSYTVTQRTHEIGIRMALGARGRDVLWMVVGQGMVLTLTGVGVGLLGALAVMRVLSSLLYGVSTTDPVTFTGMALVLVSAALAGCLVPAWRAMKVDPMEALRYE